MTREPPETAEPSGEPPTTADRYYGRGRTSDDDADDASRRTPGARPPDSAGAEGAIGASRAAVDVTPSDIVLMRSSEMARPHDQWIGSSFRFPGQTSTGLKFDGSGQRLFEGGSKTSTEPWAVAMITTALLALERAGQVRFDQRDAPRWFGLSSEAALFVDRQIPGSDTSEWPRSSVERVVRAPGRISDTVHSWLVEDHGSPSMAALELGRDGLVSRGFVRVQVETRLRGLTTTRRYYLQRPPDDVPASVASDLMTACASERPEVWRLLNKEALRGLRRRQRSSDASYAE